MGLIFSDCRNEYVSSRSIENQESRRSLSTTSDHAYLGIFVRGLLPLLGHGLGQRLGEEVDGVENEQGGDGELGHLEENLPALTLGGQSTGTVRTESNPVG